MQSAVDIVNDSAHPVNKIAAALAGDGPSGHPFSVAYTNYWPLPILKRIGPDRRIGNASGTIHAETACILNAPKSGGARVFITDPFCPNCAKNMAEAGIRAIYIDHKGFDKDFSRRRNEHFEDMSMYICEVAGISVYEIRRKERSITPILEISPDYTPPEDNPAQILSCSAGKRGFHEAIADAHAFYEGTPFALAAAHDPDGAPVVIRASTHPVPGLTRETDSALLEKTGEKYSYYLEPLNRVMMRSRRHGLAVNPQFVYSSRMPTSREQVNAVGAGLTRLQIGNPNDCRDTHGIAAAHSLAEKGIITYRTLSPRPKNKP